MNKVFLIGNLTKDPELTETKSGTKVCKFFIAVPRQFKNDKGEKETDFFNCTAWRAQGEVIAKYCSKGSKVAVTGSIQLRTYQDNKGIEKTAVDIIVQDCEFLSTQNKAQEEKKGNPKQEIMEFDDDGDIPF